jgi:class 3 adenylate cyclase/tetratricopeptide (TPR) repeat protein
MNFCGGCGAKLAKDCPACGFANSPSHRFCGKCGSPLDAASTPSSARLPVRFASPDAYIPPHLAEKILTSRSTLQGERKQVTVLFGDLKGSMELIADRDPEEAGRLLHPVVERMMAAVHRYEGTVSEVRGDGILALFGAPIAHEDHAVRACYAALNMQETVNQYGDQLQRAGGIPVQIRVGLNSGEVVVQSISSDLRIEYTAVGQTVHLASRMEQMAKPGSVLMTGSTLRLAEGFAHVKPIGPVPIKGLAEPIGVFELTGAVMRTRWQVVAARGLTRFVGRQAELLTLARSLERARDGQGQIVALVGDPGVGKSRVTWEFANSHHTRGWLVLSSSSISHGKATAYYPIVDLLRMYFNVESRDDERRIKEKVSGKLRTLDKTLMGIEPVFFSLFDVPTEDPGWEALDPLQRRQRTLDAVKRVLLRESQVQPVCLVFEDLHWIDPETEAVLNSLVESLPTNPLFLLVNYRHHELVSGRPQEYRDNWTGRSYYTQLRIDPFPRESAGELLEALLGNDASLGDVKKRLIKQTEGNPFFLEESVRALVETGALDGGPGAYRLAKAPEQIKVPDTVQAVLAARIDRLPTQDKHLLQCASAIGKDVPYALLEAIVQGQLRASLDRLQAAEFLYETRLFPELEFTFKHALTHQVTYGSLLHDRCRALHAQIMEAIERLGGDGRPELVDQLARHAYEGGVWDKALSYSRQAGERAVGQSASEEAVKYFENALVALKHLPESRELLEQAIDIRFKLRVSLLALGALERIRTCLGEAEQLATRLNDQPRLGRLSAYMSGYYYVTGEQQRALEFGQRALAIARDLDDFGLMVEAHFRVGQVYHALGDYPKAISILETCIDFLQGDPAYEKFGLPGLPAVIARTWLALCLAERGDFHEAVARGREGVAMAESIDHPYSLAYAYWGVGHAYLRAGEFEKAIEVLERGLSICRDWHITVWIPRYACDLGSAYAHSARLDDALPLLEEAVAKADDMKFAVHESSLVAALSEGYLLAGRAADALRSAQRALDLARAHRERGHEAWIHRLLGEMESRNEPVNVETAKEEYRQSLVLAEGLGMRPLAAQCHDALAKLN